MFALLYLPQQYKLLLLNFSSNVSGDFFHVDLCVVNFTAKRLSALNPSPCSPISRIGFKLVRLSPHLTLLASQPEYQLIIITMQ